MRFTIPHRTTRRQLTARIGTLALAAAAPALLVITFLVGSTPDEEEFRWGVLSSVLHFRALAEGGLLPWTSVLGLGMPQPMVPNYNMHPLGPLLAALSAGTWIRLLFAAHTVLGAFGMWHLARRLQISPLTRAICVFTFLLATPTQNYALTDFWPSHYVMWTSAPWLLLLAWRLLDSVGRDAARVGVMLGLCGGVVLASTHPGHAPVYGIVVLAAVAAHWRAVLDRWQWLAMASAIALAIAAPNLLQLATERTIFNAALGIVKLPEPLPPDAAWDVFLRPFSRSDSAWEVDLVSRGTRVLFFGGPFAALAILAAARFWRTHPDLVLATAMGVVLLFTPLLPLTFVSRFHFRDPLLLCAIPLAGLAADYLLRARRTRPLAAILLVAQTVVVGAATSPFVEALWNGDARQAMWYRGATADTPLVDGLLPLLAQGGRLAYSPQVDYEISMGEGLPDGLGVNALAYRGVPVINGSFKGIATDVLWPDDRLFYGRIRLPRQLVESDEGLDVLGVRYLLAKERETVAPGLRAVSTMPQGYRSPLVLYENPDASPGAFLVDDPGRQLPALPAYPDCINDRLLCRDLGPLARLRREERVDVTRAGGKIDVRFDHAAGARLLVVVEMFRPEWRASSADGLLATVSLGPGLLGVAVPAGATAVHLSYRATMLTAATILAWCVLAGALVALGVLWRSSRSG